MGASIYGGITTPGGISEAQKVLLYSNPFSYFCSRLNH